MKEKVKLLIVPLFHAVVIQCLYLDSRYNYKSDTHDTDFTASNGFTVESSDAVYIEGDGGINLYHDPELPDDNTAIHHFDTDEERDTYIMKLRDAITDWSQNWEGFKESQTTDELSPGTGDKITIHV